MSNPQQLRYSKEHEWLSVAEDGVSTVGITEFAANALGDVVYAQLPDVGSTVTAGESCGELESTKSVSDLYSPVGGEVTEINEDVVNDPSLVNSAPFEGVGCSRCASRRSRATCSPPTSTPRFPPAEESYT